METEIKKPFISVIIPAHNEESAISPTIDSVKNDLYGGDMEIIVACNACTDKTEEIARSKGVRVETSEKSGMGFGKNLGGKVAEGDVLLFLDADTRLIPGTLSAVGKCYQKNHNSELIGTMIALLDKPNFFEKLVYYFVNIIQYIRKLPTPSGAIFITRNLYNKIGGFAENIPQGTSSELVLKSLHNGGKWIFLRNGYAITSPRRFRKVGIFKQLFSWIVNVRLLKKNEFEKLTERDYEDIR